jgi:2-polyprenyl-3-methyl-5-hydroxy-6-metoxy-1,4-benzoquinol methylase
VSDRVSLARRLARAVGLGRRPHLPSRETWEREYQQGSWAYLGSAEEMPRYAVLARYLHQHCPGASLVDAGCGEGILLDHLWPGSWSSYLGIDFSARAIQLAQVRRRANVEFVEGDVASHDPGPEARYDAVIFNEVLYCTPNPAAVVAHWLPRLKPGGMLLASIYAPWLESLAPILRSLDSASRSSTAFEVAHPASGRRWSIRIWTGLG